MRKMQRPADLLFFLLVVLVVTAIGNPSVWALDPAEVAISFDPTQHQQFDANILVLPDVTNLLVVGTCLNPTGTNNDVYSVDPDTDVSASVETLFPVGGATADPVTQMIYFTSSSGSTNIDQLFVVPFTGGAPASLGTIIDTSDGGAQRIDGLAISGGVLYGSYAGASAEDGLWTIDPTTMQATLVGPFADSISGIDADPQTGIIYGVNDTSGQLVTVSTGGIITNVAAYPAGIVDIDGLAVGEGLAFLVTDEAGSIYVYDLVGGTYLTDLTSPFTAADTFSGAAFATTTVPVDLQQVDVE